MIFIFSLKPRNTNPNTAHIMDMLQTFHFSQAVSGPTHHCGHTLSLVVLWEADYLLHSVSICHSLSSNHLPVMCSLDISKPESCPLIWMTRNLCGRQEAVQIGCGLACKCPAWHNSWSVQYSGATFSQHSDSLNPASGDPLSSFALVLLHRIRMAPHDAGEMSCRDAGCPLDWQFTKKSWTLNIKLVHLLQC